MKPFYKELSYGLRRGNLKWVWSQVCSAYGFKGSLRELLAGNFDDLSFKLKYSPVGVAWQTMIKIKMSLFEKRYYFRFIFYVFFFGVNIYGDLNR